MSASILLDPTRPNKVADDLESIIYVITECLLRFYPHDLSWSPPKDTNPQEIANTVIRSTNLKAKPLVDYVTMTFYECSYNDSSLAVGGRHKLQHIRAGHPGFELRKGEKARELEYQHLLKKLYELLQEHYNAIKPELEASDLLDVAPPVERKGGLNRVLVMHSKAILAPKEAVNKSYNPRVHSGKPTAPPQRVLDDHSTLRETLKAYLFKPKKEGDKSDPEPWEHTTLEKTADQYEDSPWKI